MDEVDSKLKKIGLLGFVLSAAKRNNCLSKAFFPHMNTFLSSTLYSLYVCIVFFKLIIFFKTVLLLKKILEAGSGSGSVNL